MDYEVLSLNDNGTARVRMTIGESVLEQDFDIGGSQSDLKDNIMVGLSVFSAEIADSKRVLAVPYQVPLNQVTTVDPATLPDIAS